jgi:hypothetical protein
VNNGYDDRKGSGGDIEIMRALAGCAKIVASDIRCPETNGASFTVMLDITNLSTNTVNYVWFTPCPTSELPAGAITVQPQPAGIIMLPIPLGTNSTTPVVVTLPGNVAGQTVCFRVTLLDREGDVCCTEKICIDVPPCDCAEVIKQEVACEAQADGTIKYNITLTIINLTHLSANPYGIAYVSILPPTGFSPSFATPTPNPIPPGGISTVQLCYYGFPGQLCFNIGLHDDTLLECCSPEPICIDLPDCPSGSDKPDTCALETKVPCCPPAPGMATINYTICNNSPFPRTYNWTAAGIVSPGCSNMLTTASFSPSSGTLGPIPPGGCMTVSISVRCDEFKPGDCAGYQICASYDAAVPPLCCEGVVYRPKQGEPVVKHPLVGGRGTEIAPGGTAPMTFELENPTTTPMRVDVAIEDPMGILTFSSSVGTDPPTSVFHTMVDLAPSVIRPLTMNAHRLDDPTRAPDFTSVEVRASIRGTPGTSEPDLAVPVRLLRSGPAGVPIVKNVRVEKTPTPQIVITIPTVADRRYQIEQASEVTGSWLPSECATPDTQIENGFLLGTGGDITCYIQCDSTQTKMFYRAAQYE